MNTNMNMMKMRVNATAKPVKTGGRGNLRNQRRNHFGTR
jgi:hypothetical protein